MSPTFQTNESEILFTIFEHIPSNGTVRVLELPSNTSPHRAKHFGSLSLVSQPPITLLTTLASTTHHVFLTLARGEEEKLIPILSEIEDADAQTPFDYGDFMRINDAYLAEHHVAGVLFVEPSATPVLLGFPDKIRSAGTTLHFFLMLYIDENDYTLLTQKNYQEVVQHLLGTKPGLVENFR